jgi:hypothetical protein
VKKNPFSLLPLLALFVPAFILAAGAERTTAFTGTWKMNAAKSKFDPGPAPQSVTVTNAPDGTFLLEEIDEQGKPVKWSHVWSGGAEVSIQGIPNATIRSKVHDHTLDETIKIDGKTAEIVQVVVSPDGRTMTTTIDGPKDHGSTMHHVLVLEKQ